MVRQFVEPIGDKLDVRDMDTYALETHLGEQRGIISVAVFLEQSFIQEFLLCSMQIPRSVHLWACLILHPVTLVRYPFEHNLSCFYALEGLPLLRTHEKFNRT